jgi:hypothetical protein
VPPDNVLVPTARIRNPLARKSRSCCHVVGGLMGSCKEECTCAPGQCTCENCPNKSTDKGKSACSCGEVCSCAPGKCTCENCPNKAASKGKSCT